MTPTLNILLLTVGFLVLAFFAAWIGRRLWLGRTRRSLVALIARKEALASAMRSLREWMESLADADLATWVGFVGDEDSVERRALGEIAHRAEIVAVESAAMPLPRVLHMLAEDLEGLARILHETSSRVDKATDPDAVLDGVGEVDLGSMEQRMAAIEAEIENLKSEYEVTDAAVYGGGMYI